MNHKHKLRPDGLRDKRQWPRYTPDQVEMMTRFLLAYRVEAEFAHQRASQLLAVASADLGTRENADWWAKVMRTIDWLLHRLPQRQQHLEVMLAEKEGRLCLKDSEPDTSSAPAPSPPASESTEKRDRPAIVGRRSGGS